VAHSYPAELADFVRANWHDTSDLAREYCKAVDEDDALPEPAVLSRMLSICYQASLLREEERPVRFRVILRSPDGFPPPGGPPYGLHRLLFAEPRPFTPDELRRLAPAVDFYRGLLGADIGPDGKPFVWGIVTCKGLLTLATLIGGRIVQPSLDIFDSEWLPAFFTDVRDELMGMPCAASSA